MVNRTPDNETRTEWLLQMLYDGRGKFVKTRHLAHLLGEAVGPLNSWMRTHGNDQLWIESQTRSSWKLREGVFPPEAIEK